MAYFHYSCVRLLTGVACLALFHICGMLIFHETLKLTGWVVLIVFGLTGVLMTWVSAQLASRIMMVWWCLLFADSTIRGFVRRYFGMRPNSTELFNAVLQSTSHESFEFLCAQWRLLAQCLCVLMIVVWLCFIAERTIFSLSHNKPGITHSRVAKGVSLVCALLFIAAFFNPVMRRENPLFFWHTCYTVYRHIMAELAELEKATSMSPDHLGSTRYTGSAGRTVVLVIGESLTRNNMSLYGYARQTTPNLSAMRDDLYVFDDVISPSYLTAFSIVKMLSPASIDAPDLWKNTPNIVQLAKAAGYKTFWLSNQMAFDGWVTLAAKQSDQTTFTNVGDMIAESNFDEALLAPVDDALNDPAPLKLVIVHLLGSHFYYNLRYPAQYKQFDDVADSVTAGMTSAGRAKWVIDARNAYDNSVTYNDYVVSNMISVLKLSKTTSPASLLYVSDHGQEVGHHRNFTRHSAIDKTGWEIPMLLWTNNRLSLSKHVLEQRPYQTDRLDATLLGLLNISTPYYRVEDDILHPRFVTKPRRMEGVQYHMD